MLEPDIAKILAAMNVPGPAAHEVPVDMARAAHEKETAVLSGPGQPVADVHERRVPGRGGDVRVRVYAPADAIGTVVYLHGGGWTIGSIESFDTICRALANAAGATVAGVDYRLAPEHPFPAGLEDCLAVTRALAAEADGAPLAVAGDSAGANLATVVARRLRGEGAPRLQVLIYPVTDAALNTPSYREFGTGHGLTAESMRRFWGLYLDGADGLQPDCSPLRAPDLEGLPPALVVTAGYDVLRDEGEAYARALERAGVPVTLRRYEGCIHGFWRWQKAADAARRAVAEVGETVRACLRS